jgi:hypothetical protein
MSGSDVAVKAAPLLGRHTDEVLLGDLGIDAAGVAKLRACGAIA